MRVHIRTVQTNQESGLKGTRIPTNEDSDNKDQEIRRVRLLISHSQSKTEFKKSKYNNKKSFTEKLTNQKTLFTEARSLGSLQFFFLFLIVA